MSGARRQGGPQVCCVFDMGFRGSSTRAEMKRHLTLIQANHAREWRGRRAVGGREILTKNRCPIHVRLCGPTCLRMFPTTLMTPLRWAIFRTSYSDSAGAQNVKLFCLLWRPPLFFFPSSPNPSRFPLRLRKHTSEGERELAVIKKCASRTSAGALLTN